MSAGLDRMLADLAPVGRDPGTGGYRRLAWTGADAGCRAWFAEQARRLGLETTTDRNGNQWAWWGDPGAGDAVVTGSHLDSVVDGGAYDGALGVASGFAALDVLAARGVRPARPVGVVAFADEEGARFGLACVGSRLLTGALAPDRARGRRDAGGTTMAAAIAGAGHDPDGLGRDDETLARVGVYVETHIEQGRGLVELDRPVGVGTGIQPHGRWRLDLTGEANHAGTTRLADRRDPMLGCAYAVAAARAAGVRHGGVATVGKVHVAPNGVTTVPARVSAWLDVRAPAAEAVRGIVADVAAAAGDADVTEESWSPAVTFDRGVRDDVVDLLGGAPVLATAAGHDAGVLAAAGVPTAMLFVRNRTGVSHAPAEHATPDDCAAAVDALARVIGAFACR